MKNFLRQGLARTLPFGLCLAVLAVLVGGCAHSRKAKAREVTMGFVAPPPPAFLAGPMAVLLTNTGGFSARVAFQTPQLSLPGEVQSGELLARGSKFLFAAHRNKAIERYILPGGYSFLWDVAENRGYLLSEALQGYAPVSLDLRVTNLVAHANQAVSQQFEGHPCTTEEATAQLSDGSTAVLQVWRATDLKGFPVRMTLPSTPTPT
ncbi:MAG TPA: hypothetical protein VNZ22_11670, partial [Bacillota bacterium]|nr:hypothetical protein [Bacillota bacterium]